MNNVIKLMNSTAYGTFARAFNTGNGWKLDADGKIAMKDGNPIYLNSAGQEQVVEFTTISRLNGEAQQNRERAEAAETKLKAFGDLDPAKARDALATVSKIDMKKLIDAGEVDKVRKEIGDQFTAQIGEKDKTIASLQETTNNMMKSHAFTTSKFVNERVAVPSGMFEATFAKNFKVEDGKIIPYDNNGNKIYSKTRVSELADFDEALEIITEGYPDKDKILKASNASGSGNGGGGGNRNGQRTIKRADFNKMPPHEQAAHSASINKGEAVLVD